jgi:hypothetical protein
MCNGLSLTITSVYINWSLAPYFCQNSLRQMESPKNQLQDGHIAGAAVPDDDGSGNDVGREGGQAVNAPDPEWCANSALKIGTIGTNTTRTTVASGITPTNDHVPCPSAVPAPRPSGAGDGWGVWVGVLLGVADPDMVTDIWRVSRLLQLHATPCMV